MVRCTSASAGRIEYWYTKRSVETPTRQYQNIVGEFNICKHELKIRSVCKDLSCVGTFNYLDHFNFKNIFYWKILSKRVNVKFKKIVNILKKLLEYKIVTNVMCL